MGATTDPCARAASGPRGKRLRRSASSASAQTDMSEAKCVDATSPAKYADQSIRPPAAQSAPTVSRNGGSLGFRWQRRENRISGAIRDGLPREGHATAPGPHLEQGDGSLSDEATNAPLESHCLTHMCPPSTRATGPSPPSPRYQSRWRRTALPARRTRHFATSSRNGPINRLHHRRVERVRRAQCPDAEFHRE